MTQDSEDSPSSRHFVLSYRSTIICILAIMLGVRMAISTMRLSDNIPKNESSSSSTKVPLSSSLPATPPPRTRSNTSSRPVSQIARSSALPSPVPRRSSSQDIARSGFSQQNQASKVKPTKNGFISTTIPSQSKRSPPPDSSHSSSRADSTIPRLSSISRRISHYLILTSRHSSSGAPTIPSFTTISNGSFPIFPSSIQDRSPRLNFETISIVIPKSEKISPEEDKVNYKVREGALGQ